MPNNAQLTLQETADLLGVSLPFVEGLLEQGHIPYQVIDTHKMIQLADVVVYQQQAHARQKAALAAMQEEAQELDMGY